MWLLVFVCFLLIEPVLLSPHPDCGGRACGSAHHKFNAADGDAADGAIVTPTAIAGNGVLAGGGNPPSSGSCIGKCHHSYVYTWNCQCNDGCKIYNDCCSDYTAVCSDVPPPPPPPPPPISAGRN